MGRVTRRHAVVRIGPDRTRRLSDTIAVEEPLEIRLNGQPFVTTMRTPGHDIDLVHGLLHAEGVIAAAADVLLARYCAGTDADGVNTYNLVDVTLGRGVEPPAPRAVLTTSACGVCGTATITELLRRGRYRLDPALRFPVSLLAAGPTALRAQQRTFEQTGGLHAAGLLGADGSMACVREDVGRHNAVDKVIGWALRAGRLPLREHVLVVSGRASYELTQKAVLAGISTLVAVSAPSSLAVELAEEAGLTLVGFARGESMNVYSHAERVLVPAPAT